MPGDGDYGTARLSANPRFDGLRPAAVARCADTADVVAALNFARDRAVPFTVRSGGHCYAGWSTGTGLVIDTSAMSAVTLSPLAAGTAGSVAGGAAVTVGAGARLADVYARVAAAGVGLPAGSCPSVGATGLTLGGGVGVLARLWGLSCDALSSVQIVTADGRVRTASEQSEPDLFWAARGGGGGSFGIVTRLTYRARPAPTLSLLALSWPWERAADVLTGWQQWAPSVDRRLWTTCKLLARGGRPRVLVAGVWAGPAGGLDTLLAGLAARVGAPPATRSVSRHGYLAAMLLEAGCVGGAACRLPPAGTLQREPLTATSHVPAKPLPSAGVAALVGAVQALAVDGDLRAAGLTETGVSLDALGGAVADVAPSATAFAHRTAPFTMQYTATYRVGRAIGGAPDDPFSAAVRGMRAVMSPFAGTTAYVNYCDSDVVDWRQAYWADNQWRLSRIKHAYDPTGVFTFPQAVDGG